MPLMKLNDFQVSSLPHLPTSCPLSRAKRLESSSAVRYPSMPNLTHDLFISFCSSRNLFNIYYESGFSEAQEHNFFSDSAEKIVSLNCFVQKIGTMSFVFRGSRGDIEAGFPDFIS